VFETVVIFDEGKVEEDLHMSYGQYLENLRDKLLMKKISYEGVCGLVSYA
jgi:hypothetical protein